MRVAQIGLGAMGMPTMRNLIAAGHELTVFDLDPEALRVAAMQGEHVRTPSF
jgi:3-hydroxyisobutyrate dehydrogenase-like beta-hydroxyacid dehydrogenase